MSFTRWWQADFSRLSKKQFLQKQQREKHQRKVQILKLRNTFTEKNKVEDLGLGIKLEANFERKKLSLQK